MKQKNVFGQRDNETLGTTQTITVRLSGKQRAIIDYIHSHPNASRKEIAANLNDITEDGVKYYIQNLQKQGIIKRVGADFGGHWEILIDNVK